jgi:hypothetical protein
MQDELVDFNSKHTGDELDDSDQAFVKGFVALQQLILWCFCVLIM